MTLRIQYREARHKLSAHKFAALVQLQPKELAQYLHKKGLINQCLQPTDLLAYWEQDNTIVLYWKGHKLTGRIRMPKKC